MSFLVQNIESNYYQCQEVPLCMNLQLPLQWGFVFRILVLYTFGTDSV